MNLRFFLSAKEFHSSVVLGVAAIQPTKTQGKTTPRKKQTVMKNQKGSSANEVKVNVSMCLNIALFLLVVHPIIDFSMMQTPEETSNRESVNKRKRGRQPRKFISTDANQRQKTGIVNK